MGFITAGPMGAIAGFVLGWLFEQGLDDVNRTENYNNREYDDVYSQRRERQAYEGQRNSFLFSLLVLAAYIVRADGRVMHSEMEVVRQFLRQNFGEAARQQGEQIVLRLFEQQKQAGAEAWRSNILNACRQIARNMNRSQRLQLLNFLVYIAQADGTVAPEELAALQEVALNLGLSQADLDSMLNLRNAGSDLDAAYKVLGIDKNATDEEVKAAYRRMALQHHPDRVATLGDDVRAAAERKFKEINEAKERIYKSRGL